MNKSPRLHTLWLPSLLALSFLSQAADDDRFAKVDIKSTHLSASAWLFEGAGGNIGVSSGDDGILIIDDQFAPLAEKITRALAATPGANKAPLPRYIINTHYHGDHTGGNDHFGAQGTILAHDNVLKRLASDGKTPKTALPVITFDNGINIRFNGDNLRVVHLGAGHTDGDSVVFWQNANVVHMGDLFFKDRFPYIDLDAGGSVTGYRDNVRSLLELIDDNTKVIPGHGTLATKADLTRFKQMLDASISWMQQGKAAGKTLEALKSEGLMEYKDWSWEFISTDKWIETLYQGL